MSDSVQTHRRQATRLRHPWDSPGKNTGVGCHFLQCMKVKSESEVAQLCPTLRDLMDFSLFRPWDFPGKSTGVPRDAEYLIFLSFCQLCIFFFMKCLFKSLIIFLLK